MGVAVKLASSSYGAGELVMFGSVVGAIAIALPARARGTSLRTEVPAMHFWRSATGVTCLVLWYCSLEVLPLSTGMSPHDPSSA